MTTTPTSTHDADEHGWFGGPGGFGGRFMPEALVAALDELTQAWQDAMADPAFVAEFERVLSVARGDVRATEVTGIGRVSRSGGRLAFDASYRHAGG